MGREDGEGGPVVYEIRVAERVSDRWSAWFGGMALDPLPDGGNAPITFLHVSANRVNVTSG